MKETHKDVVCGMDVSEDSQYQSTYHHMRYYFCGGQCKSKFDASPETYLHTEDTKKREETKSCPDGSCDINPGLTQYTCPMHPEIIQDGPGICPICGMSLEPVMASAEEDDGELKAMTQRFWFSAFLALPLFMLAMTADMMPSLLPKALSIKALYWIEFFLATPVVLWGGWPFFVRAWHSVRTWNPNMFTLIALGVSVAWVYSVVALLFPAIFPPQMRSTEGTVYILC